MKATNKKESIAMDPSDPPRVGSGPQSATRGKHTDKAAKAPATGTGEGISTNSQKRNDHKQLGDESEVNDDTTI